MVQVVINDAEGYFDLSREALDEYRSITGDKHIRITDIPRHDPVLVDIVNRLGAEASTEHSRLAAVTISGDTYIVFEYYEGKECVLEPQDLEWTTVE